MKKVAVIGAGITGLSAAYELKKRKFEVSVFESSSRVGGVIQTDHEEDFLAEAGPNSMRVTQPEVQAFLQELDLISEIAEANPKIKKRFIVRGGKPLAISPSPLAILTSSIISPGAKMRVLREPFVGRGNPDEEESVGEFVRRRVGSEILDYIVNPLITGIYAGDPENLSVRSALPRIWALEQKYGSILKGSRKTQKRRKKGATPSGMGIVSFRKGMHTIPQALGERLQDKLILRSDIRCISEVDGWKLAWNQEGKERTESFQALILSLPAHRAASLPFAGPTKESIAFLSEIPYAPLSIVVSGHRRKDVQHPLDGFGMLVPAIETRNILGTIFSSTMFPDRCPEGHVTLTTLLGGMLRPELASMPPDDLTRLTADELRMLLGVMGEPVFTKHYFWERAIPQYVLGYGKILESIAEVERAHPTLSIIGNFRDGVAVGDCIFSGIDTARKVAALLD